MELTFLGTSAGVPTKERNLSALALQSENHSGWMLFDCGEATQHRILQSSLSLARLERIFITHLHGDHVFGIFGLLASRGMLGVDSPLELYGPPGLRELIETPLRLSGLHLPFPLKIRQLRPKEELNLGEFELTVIPLSHSITSYAYLLRWKDRPGRFDPQKAQSLGIPPGPDYGRLKKGESLPLPDGRIVEPAEVLGPPRPGRRILIAGDNDRPDLLIPYGPVDLLVHECTYTQEDFDRLSRRYMHTTALALGKAAQQMKALRLAATHFSARYDKNGLEKIEKEIRLSYEGELILAEDFLKISL